MKTLLRLTRHIFTQEQKDYLEEKYGVLLVINYPQSVNKDTMIALQALYSPDLVEVTLPINLTATAVEVFKCPVIKAVMHRKVTTGGNRETTFSHYEHIKKVHFEKEII